MAHYVGKVLCIRPSEILDTWGVPELLVAFGQYANEVTYKNFKEWEALDKSVRKGINKPEEYAVRFYSPDKLEEKEADDNGNRADRL